MSPEYPNSFCPVSILTSYFTEHNKLITVEGEEFLFPKLSTNFEKGGELQILTNGTPPKCIPRECFSKKFITISNIPVLQLDTDVQSDVSHSEDLE